MWATEDSPGPKAAYRGGGIILPLAALLVILLQDGLLSTSRYELVSERNGCVLRNLFYNNCAYDNDPRLYVMTVSH